MKQLFSTSISLLFYLIVLFPLKQANAQDAGNVNYQNSYGNFRQKTINVKLMNSHNLEIRAKGLSNIKADAYVAMFSITQTGKDIEEVNTLIDKRIDIVKRELSDKVTLHIDMISFVPMYEYGIEKKIFSKTYNEVPTGFELKKNLHIKYTDPKLIHKLIAICSKAEIHELVKVDYNCTKIDTLKKELRNKVKDILLDKMNFQQELIGSDFSTLEKDIADGFEIRYPSEMYRSYSASSRTSLNIKRGKVNQATKSKVLYYQPILDKEFDVVINPVILEPVIQLMYEVVIEIRRDRKIQKPKKDYFIVTPTGELKQLKIGN